MRCVVLGLLSVLPLASGCAGLIAHTGEDFGDLVTREDVRNRYGAKIADGGTTGEAFDTFRYHGKVSTDTYYAYGLTLCLTCGSCELVTVPKEVYKTGRGFLLGQEIRFNYDESGNITYALADGDTIPPSSDSPRDRNRPRYIHHPPEVTPDGVVDGAVERWHPPLPPGILTSTPTASNTRP